MFGLSKKERKLKEDRNKVTNLILKLISNKESKLDSKYFKTHGKLAIEYNDHHVELILEDHGEKFVIKYYKSKIILTKKQFNQITVAFNQEKKSRSGCTKDFDTLDSLINN